MIPITKAVRLPLTMRLDPKIEALEDEVRDLAYQLIDDFIDDGHCEWVKQFAIPLPLLIIGKQMGANPDDIWQIKEWTEAFFHRISLMQSEEEELISVRKEIEAQHYFQPIFERLREKPDDSLLSALVNTVIEGWGRPLNDNELHAEMMADTFVGGSETTTNAISAGVKLLIENPAAWEQLKSDPDRYLKVFIEEVLRLESPVQSLMRATAKDVELSGVTILAGSLINVLLRLQTGDERRFDNPDALDLDRPRAGGHMAFGSGKHHLGAPLARRELHWSFKALVDRIDSMWFAEGKNDFSYHPHYLLRAMSLHIEFKGKVRPSLMPSPPTSRESGIGNTCSVLRSVSLASSGSGGFSVGGRPFAPFTGSRYSSATLASTLLKVMALVVVGGLVQVKRPLILEGQQAVIVQGLLPFEVLIA